jgi:hypothetical protein
MKKYLVFALSILFISCQKADENQTILEASLVNISDDQVVSLGSKVQIHVELPNYVLDLDYEVKLSYQGVEMDNDPSFSLFNYSTSGSYGGNVRNMYAEIDVPKDIDGIPVKPGDYKLQIQLKDRKGHTAKLWRDIVLQPKSI